jgi:hypothetical protein
MKPARANAWPDLARHRPTTTQLVDPDPAAANPLATKSSPFRTKSSPFATTSTRPPTNRGHIGMCHESILAVPDSPITPDHAIWNGVELPLEARMLAAREANRKAQALAAYTDEQEAMANHAVAGHLDAASRDIEHVAVRNPQIAERYSRVLTIMAQRRDAITTGIARANASKAEAKKP